MKNSFIRLFGLRCNERVSMLFNKKEKKPDVTISLYLCVMHKDYCQSQSKKNKGKPAPVLVSALFNTLNNCPNCKVEYAY
jgi:hypothetical protein